MRGGLVRYSLLLLPLVLSSNKAAFFHAGGAKRVTNRTEANSISCTIVEGQFTLPPTYAGTEGQYSLFRGRVTDF